MVDHVENVRQIQDATKAQPDMMRTHQWVFGKNLGLMYKQHSHADIADGGDSEMMIGS